MEYPAANDPVRAGTAVTEAGAYGWDNFTGSEFTTTTTTAWFWRTIIYLLPRVDPATLAKNKGKARCRLKATLAPTTQDSQSSKQNECAHKP